MWDRQGTVLAPCPMAMTAGTDYLYIPKIQLSQMSATATMINGMAVCTPRYVFVVPESAAGSVLVANIGTTYFPGQDLRAGVETLLEEPGSVEEVETSLLELLAGDKKTDFTFELGALSKFKIHSWWFNMVTLKRKDRAVNRLVIKGKPHKSAFKSFYAEPLGLAQA